MNGKVATVDGTCNVWLMKKSELYPYLAGIIDGEGSIGIAHYKGKKYSYRMKRENFLPYMSCGMTYKGIPKMLHKEFGGAFYEQKYKEKESRKALYIWKLNNAKPILECLNKIEKFLIVKKRNARLVRTLAERMNKQNGQNPLSVEELNIRSLLRERARVVA